MRRPLIAGLALAAVGVVAASAAALGLRDDGPGAKGDAALPPATADVVRQTLKDTENVTGTLGHGKETKLLTGLSGVVTGLPTSGRTIRRGQTLYRVDDDPVVLLQGGLPAYRTLSTGLSGRDVLQFEKNLWALGYRGFTVDDAYTWATAAAVKKWQDDLGLPETGTVEPSRVHYADGPLRVQSLQAAKGDPVQPGGTILTVTGRDRAVSVTLDVDDQRLAKKGARVGLTLPDGEKTTGRVTGVETVVTPAPDDRSDPETEIKVTVSLDRPKDVASFGDASVSVSFTAEVRENVLAVPVQALLALAEGGYGVEVVRGGTTRVVAVETGLFAAGMVEVASSELAEGDKVGVPA
ncbi:peptidoglycan-binding protein [Actinocorallia sp. API 0066]|uniref:efflux RND transporter periplasmic adaptor subunit n=1 Tax=Actinocorallia sp. API 0066 TaxID=2896846 RepID=UPI001E43C6EA|nr:peptidoglycan-binding protein [Actinocorallia sp. API 0066]MCD0453268.1 peptidoglycan-binding protein [Actinocorallia sp. API 0066]